MVCQQLGNVNSTSGTVRILNQLFPALISSETAELYQLPSAQDEKLSVCGHEFMTKICFFQF